jgi:cytochrome c oxidase subunit II
MLRFQVLGSLLNRFPTPARRNPPAVCSKPMRWIPLVLLLLAGCHREHFQSMVHPKGPAASGIAGLWWFLFFLCSAIFAIVLVLTALALWRGSGERRVGPALSMRFVVISGIVIPAVILVVLLFVSLGTQVSLQQSNPTTIIRVTGHQWWWEVRYPEHGLVTANEIHIPVGEAIGLELDSGDVIHSFWVPNLAGKLDALPDHINRMTLQADEPGIYRGQCAEYCGTQHAQMAFHVVALPKEEFEEWLDEQRSPGVRPDASQAQRGFEVFSKAGCNQCHAVGGTAAKANIGPDLTNLRTRRSLAAGMLPNNRKNLAAWITDPQAVKPGNRMPHTELSKADLEALLEYLLGPPE